MSNVEAFSYAALVTPAVFGSMFGTIENELPDSAFSYSSPLAPIKTTAIRSCGDGRRR